MEWFGRFGIALQQCESDKTIQYYGNCGIQLKKDRIQVFTRIIRVEKCNNPVKTG